MSARRRRSPGRGAGAVALLVALLPLFSAREASAFCRRVALSPGDARDAVPQTGKQTGICEFARDDASAAYEYWPGRCVGFAITLDGAPRIAEDDAVATVTRGLLRWSRAKCAGGSPSLEGRYVGRSRCATAGFNREGPNQNVVIFHGTWPYRAQDGADDDLKLGVTTTTANVLTGEVLDADIEINIGAPSVVYTPDGVPGTGDYDLDSVVTHELGHALGLAHSLDNKATMWRSIAPGSIASRDLAADDEAGFCFLYPPAATRPRKARGTSPDDPAVDVPAGACDVRPSGGYSATCEEPGIVGCALDAPSAPGSILVAAGAALTAAVARARRRR